LGLSLLKTLDTLHRWAGGLIGLVLALLGLSGAILVHRDAWVMVPHAHDAKIHDVGMIASATARIMGDPADPPASILYADDGFGLLRLTYKDGVGAYADQTGLIVMHWDSQWQRPELWLFDFHHHLFAGDSGERVIAVAGMCGLFFVLSGAILWWRQRRLFEFRLLPRRLSRPSIVRHHRDLGIVAAPLLLLSLYTGTTFVARPMTALALGPGAPAVIERASKPPKAPKADLAPQLDWAQIIRTAYGRFPRAELRSIALPRNGTGLITLRMRQPEEWLPNGRTMLWFAADSGRLVEARDVRAQDWRSRAFNLFYPLHAAKVGGLAYRLLMTLSGLVLTMLGGLAVWSFWFGKRRQRPRPEPARQRQPI
jgi:uncharacterized iron-regulated membrane protein